MLPEFSNLTARCSLSKAMFYLTFLGYAKESCFNTCLNINLHKPVIYLMQLKPDVIKTANHSTLLLINASQTQLIGRVTEILFNIQNASQRTEKICTCYLRIQRFKRLIHWFHMCQLEKVVLHSTANFFCKRKFFISWRRQK